MQVECYLIKTVSGKSLDVMDDTQLFSKFALHLNHSQDKSAVSVVIADCYFDLSQGGLCGHVWSNMHSLPPHRLLVYTIQ